MREPTPRKPKKRGQQRVFGLMAEFDRPERLLDGIKETRVTGFRKFDAYTPFPVEGLPEAMDFRDNRVPWLTFAGGLVGAASGYGMQVYTNADFPIDIGGRPLLAIPAFMLITFELTVLCAVLFAIGGMLALNHLPRLHHPVFDVDSFHFATSNKFFLVIFSSDSRFDDADTREFLESLGPMRIDVIEHTEEPE